MPPWIDLTGQRFGRLLVVAESVPRGRPSRWTCQCDCGVRKSVSIGELRSGGTVSCGCLKRDRLTTHGKHATATYRAWVSMIQRCTNPRSQSWDLYGARGITVSDRWKTFEAFLADMGECPRGLSIDRIDNDRGYEPDNCRWVTPLEQARNRRTTRVNEQLALEILGRYEYCGSGKVVADQVRLPYRTVLAVIHGDTWAELSRPWRKPEVVNVACG